MPPWAPCDEQRSNPPNEKFGSTIHIKGEEIIRIAGLNVGRFPLQKDEGTKQNIVFTHVRSINADIIGFSEINLNPQKLPRHQQWSERSRGQFENLKSTLATNVHAESSSPVLCGGAGILCKDHMTSRVCESGNDPSGLGRWAWM
jgi:hypothetical protein